MRKGTIQKIEEEINEKRKMPKEVKESLRKEIFTNIIICACLVAYFLFLFLGSVDKTKLEEWAVAISPMPRTRNTTKEILQKQWKAVPFPIFEGRILMV